MENVNHPCYGMSCEDCTTCRFDVDLFKDGVLPTEKKKQTKKENKHNNEMKPICNYCGFLIKNYLDDERRFFNACCTKRMIDNGDVKRPMVIDFNTYEMADIERPNWCPIHPMGEEREEGTSQLALPCKVEGEHTNEETTVPNKPFKEMTYTEKREAFKQLPKRLEWDDIKEGEYYLIPRIMTTPRKIVHVELKTENCLRCHEVSEYTGTEYSYVTNIFSNDIEAAVIVELHNF